MEQIKAKRSRHYDRVTLTATSLTRINSWISEITSKEKGVTLTHKDIINWLIGRHTDKLSPEEMQELKSQFFDEVKFLQAALRELRTAKAQ